MDKKSGRFMTAFAAWALMGSPVAKAGPDEAALIAQVKQLASQGQSPQTAAQVDQFVDQNQDVISAFLKGYMNYLKQLQGDTANDGSDAPAQPQKPPPDAGQGKAQAQAGSTAAGAGNTTGIGTGNPPGHDAGSAPRNSAGEPSNGLLTPPVQGSEGLRTSHLAGYPSLPDVDPVSSLHGLTAGQMEYAAEVERQMQERKQYLMQHPEGYTY
jgi:hypothetical protein